MSHDGLLKLLWNDGLTAHYEGRPNIRLSPAEIPFLPWKKPRQQWAAYVDKSEFGPLGIPLTLDDNPSPETATNLQQIVEHLKNGEDVYLRGRVIIKQKSLVERLADPSEWIKPYMALFGRSTLDGPQRHVYSGTIEVNGTPTYTFYVDMSPQLRRGEISRIRLL